MLNKILILSAFSMCFRAADSGAPSGGAPAPKAAEPPVGADKAKVANADPGAGDKKPIVVVKPANRAVKPEMVRVRVKPLYTNEVAPDGTVVGTKPHATEKRHVYEDQIYRTGDVFETSEERAAALAEHVDIVPDATPLGAALGQIATVVVR